jgi:arsenite methyltransferase
VRATGVDAADAMVARGRRRFRGEMTAGRLQLCRASAEALPLADAVVDKAASVASLYFWPDPPGAFAELARVVRPGGTVAIAFEPPEELAKWPGARFGFRFFGEEEVRGLLEGAGFGEIRASWGSGRKPDRFLCLTARRRGGEAGR